MSGPPFQFVLFLMVLHLCSECSSAAFLKGGNKRADADGAAF